MSDSMNDVELVGEFSKRAESSYRSGVEFILTNPIFSLREFRVSLECLCHDLAFDAGVRSDFESLHDAIEALADSGVITLFVKDTFHQARILCNDAAHSPVWRKGGERSRIVVSASENERRANRVRELLIDALKNIRKVQGKGGVEVINAEIDTQRWKNLLYEAFMPSSPVGKSPVEKFRAGEYLESLAEKELSHHPEYIVSDEVGDRISFYTKAAAVLYEAAYRENPQNREAAFRYASMVDDKVAVEKRKGEAKEIFEFLMRRGNLEARERYAWIVYEEGGYEEARDCMIYALEHGGKNAAYGLSLYYLEGKAVETDYREVFRYLEIGVSQGSAECMYSLGMAFWEGSWGAERDKARARELLEKAAALGHRGANGYLTMFLNRPVAERVSKLPIRKWIVNPSRKKMEKRSKKTANSMVVEYIWGKKHSMRKGINKIPPNSPCTCGSGKKYKKCCGAS